MWPEPGSGFEADPYSPAGTAEREWWLLQGLEHRGWGRRSVQIVSVFAVALLALPVVMIVATLVHRIH